MNMTNPEVEVSEPEAEVVTSDQTDDKVEVGNEVEEEVDGNIDGTETEDTGEDPNFEEVEYEGNKYSLPKELKEALMRNADYTQKTQEVSKTRKEIETQKEEARKEIETQRAEFKSYAEVYSIDQQLEQYKNLDWDKLADENPNEFLKLDRAHRQLKENRDKKLFEINQSTQNRTLKQQQEYAKLEEDTATKLRTEIKGWSPELKNQLTNYAKSLGAPEDNIQAVMKYSPMEVKVLHKAYLFDQLQKKAAQKPVEQPAKPVTKIAGGKTKSYPTEFRSDMSDAEYDKYREHLKKKKNR